MSRKVCQGDVLRFIVRKIPGAKNRDIKELYEEIRGYETYDSRISEYINLKRNGIEDFSGKEECFFNRFFKDQDLDVVYDNLLAFLKEEDLSISYEPLSEDNTKEDVIRRFLQFGLSNEKKPKQSPDNYIDHPNQFDKRQEGSGLTSEEQVMDEGRSEIYKKTVSGFDQKETVSHSSDSIIQILEQNFKAFIVIGTIAILLSIILTFFGIGLNEVLLCFLLLPKYVFIPMAIVLAVSPKAIGLIDAYIHFCKYRRQTKGEVSFKTFAKYGNRNGLDEGEGVFDAGTINLIYGLICNLTGALINIALYLYASTLEGLTGFIKKNPGIVLMFIAIYSTFVILNWNIKMQQRPMPDIRDEVSENPKIYQLNRSHVLFTILHLSFSIIMGAYVVFYIFWYMIKELQTQIELNPLFILVIITSTVYLWYASKSSYAKVLKVDCGWLIHLIPVMAILTTLYIECFFSNSLVTRLCLFANLLSIWLWRCAVKDKYTLFPDIKKTEQTE